MLINKILSLARGGKRKHSPLRLPVILITLAILLTGCTSQQGNPSGQKELRQSVAFEAVEQEEVFLTLKPKPVEEPKIRTGLNDYKYWTSEPTGMPKEVLENLIPEYLQRHIVYFYLEEPVDEYSWTAGLAWGEHGMIAIKPKFVDNLHVIYHEVGHLIDYRFSPVDMPAHKDDWLSGQTEWRDIWVEEWSNENCYAGTSLVEGFAEVFSAYLTGMIDHQPFNLEQEKPLSYSYMEYLLSVIKEDW